MPSYFVIALLRGFSNQCALPLELVPVHATTFIDTHNSPRFLCLLAASLRSATELAPLAHTLLEFFLTPLLLSGFGAALAHEARRVIDLRHTR
jgi:hypothetical protein